MGSYKVELTIAAKKDLRDIYFYISNNLKAPATADKLLDKMEAKLLTLKRNPFLYAVERNEQLKRRNLHKLIVDNYLIFYIVNEKTSTVYIVRVLYARRDCVNLL